MEIIATSGEQHLMSTGQRVTQLFFFFKKLIGPGNGSGSGSKFLGPGCNRFQNFGTSPRPSSTRSEYGPGRSELGLGLELGTQFFCSVLLTNSWVNVWKKKDEKWVVVSERNSVEESWKKKDEEREMKIRHGKIRGERKHREYWAIKLKEREEGEVAEGWWGLGSWVVRLGFFLSSIYIWERRIGLG